MHTKGETLAVKPTGHTDVQVCMYVSLARPCRHAQSLSLAGRESVLTFVLFSLRCRPVFHYALQQQQQQQQFNITLNVFTNPPFENWQKLWHSALSLSLSLSVHFYLCFPFAPATVVKKKKLGLKVKTFAAKTISKRLTHYDRERVVERE